MSRDDWKYYDDDVWEEDDSEKKKEKTIQCPHCTHYVDADSPFCSWCGRPLEKL